MNGVMAKLFASKMAMGVAAGVGAIAATTTGVMVVNGKERAAEEKKVQTLVNRMAATKWNVPSRAAQEAALRGSSPTKPFDLLVVGGGATGCGVALDGVTRGLRVGLIERDDFASGTSSRSTKLIHGGVRYLEKAVFQLDYKQLQLVFHALDERARMIQNAPHLCHPLPTMTPCYKWWEVPYYWSGLKMYDLVAGRQMLHLSSYNRAKTSLATFPTLAKTNIEGKNLKGTVVYYDGQMNDARVNVSLACTAALAGANVLNHAEATSVIQDEATKRVVGLRVKDHISGEDFDVYAKVVVNAGGPFSDGLRKLADGSSKHMIEGSSGVHIVLPDYYGPENMGLIVPKTKDGRVVFMLPWLGKIVAGTTDAKTKITSLPRPKEEEVQFILDTIKDYVSVETRRSDVLSTWSGIRPLVTDPSSTGSTENMSRDHVVCVEPHGMVTIAGGKWTTYRSMAEDAVNAAVKSAKLTPQSGCLTKNLPLIGAVGYDSLTFAALAQSYTGMKKEGEKVTPTDLDTATAKHLASSYGGMASRVVVIAQNEALGQHLAKGYPYLEAEVAYCARNEYCETAVDFIARRARLAFLDTKAADQALPRVVEILAEEHKWDKTRVQKEFASAKAFLETFKPSNDA